MSDHRKWRSRPRMRTLISPIRDAFRHARLMQIWLSEGHATTTMGGGIDGMGTYEM